MKRCSKCKQQLSINNFGKNKSHKDGLNNECKSCAKISVAKARNNNLTELELLQKQARNFANNQDLAIQDVLAMAKQFDIFIEKHELED